MVWLSRANICIPARKFHVLDSLGHWVGMLRKKKPMTDLINKIMKV